MVVGVGGLTFFGTSLSEDSLARLVARTKEYIDIHHRHKESHFKKLPVGLYLQQIVFVFVVAFHICICICNREHLIFVFEERILYLYKYNLQFVFSIGII